MASRRGPITRCMLEEDEMKQFMGVRFEEVLDPKTKELVLLAASAVGGCGP